MIRRAGWIVFVAGMLLKLPASVIASENTAGLTIHVVHRGENLYGIALSYGATAEALARLNSMVNSESLEVGQRLLVPARNAAAESLAFVHVVQAGETLQSIADDYGESVEQLAALNAIGNADSLYVGQSLTITPSAQVSVAPPADTAVAAPLDFTVIAPPNRMFHTVQPGETLYRIASAYGLAVSDLVQANGLEDPTLIDAGQQLVVPVVQPPQSNSELPVPITGIDIAPQVLVEGQTGRIRVTTSLSVTVSATFMGRTLQFAPERDNTLNTALVGIRMFTPAGIYPLSLTVTEATARAVTFNVNIRVVSGNYEVQTLELSEEKSELLDPAIENYELGLLQSLTSTYTPERYFVGLMSLPAAAAMNSPFGTRRSFNGDSTNRFHYGADFAAVPGTPVLAANSGRVILADTLNIRGVATVIDHGWGVYTTYSHQTESYVHVGDFVTLGQPIGTVGDSGRVTGAHLHWEVWVGGVSVDPMQWTVQSFL